jgi:SAM-dependent methyltransferase
MARDDARYSSALARTLRHGSRALYADPAVYDALYRRRSRDVRFYVELAQHSGGPVLELGVGSARVAAAIARAGIEVWGVDALPAMLARARVRLAALPAAARALVTLRRGDLRTLALRRRFPLVIAPFNALLHLYDARALVQALTAARRHLAPNGRLVFDVVLPSLRRLAQDPERLYASGRLFVPEHDTHYGVREASHYDAARQIHTTVFVLEPVRGPGQARAIPLTHRQIFPAELPLLLDAAGLTIERHEGDFAGGALDANSECQIVVARAKRAVSRRRRV